MKRCIDFVIALCGLVVLSPLLLAIALAVRIDMGSPVIFSQLRPGYDGRPFRIFKFRTMTDGRNSSGELLKDGDRLTRLGRFLRASSLDELPELMNVLRGEMSLVGPRPLLMQYLPYYNQREQLRHTARPGITGWAQVHGRNQLPWDQRLELDIWYIEHQSLLLDLRILLSTILAVLRSDGIATDPDTVETDLNIERRHWNLTSGSGAAE